MKQSVSNFPDEEINAVYKSINQKIASEPKPFQMLIREGTEMLYQRLASWSMICLTIRRMNFSRVWIRSETVCHAIYIILRLDHKPENEAEQAEQENEAEQAEEAEGLCK